MKYAGPITRTAAFALFGAFVSCADASDHPSDTGSMMTGPQDPGSTSTVPTPPGAGQIPTTCQSLEVTGVEPGDIAPSVSLRDSAGNPFNTHSLCDKTVLLIAGSMF